MLPSGSLIGRNPYETFPQIPTICQELGIQIGPEPTEDEIQTLFDTLGKGKVYGANAEELAIGDEIYLNHPAMDAIEQMLGLFGPRSVYGNAGPTDAVIIIGTGATANWMVRRAAEGFFYSRHGVNFNAIYLVGGNRPMEDKAGQPNPLILEHMEEHEDQLPLEWQLLAKIWHARFGRWHDDVVHESDDLDVNITVLAEKHPDLATAKVYVPLNAAAVDKAIQVRAQLRRAFPEFDSNPEDPQFYFSSDHFPLAYTPEEADDPGNYQRPKTFLSAIPRYVKQFNELTA